MTAQQIGVIVLGTGIKTWGVTGVTYVQLAASQTCSAEVLRRVPHWFVMARAVDLPDVAEWVRDANRRRKLRGLLIHQTTGLQFATAMLWRAQIHTLAPTLVHSDLGVLRRVIEAWAVGAQDRLIADATIQGERLFVRTCGLDLLEVDPQELRELRHLSTDELARFEIDEDGSFLVWPQTDVHVGIDSIRSAVEPGFREQLAADALAYDEALGRAIRAFRERAGLRQSDIPGLSARQVGRIERGEVRPRLDSLRRLAEASGVTTAAYLDALAEPDGRPVP